LGMVRPPPRAKSSKFCFSRFAIEVAEPPPMAKPILPYFLIFN